MTCAKREVQATLVLPDGRRFTGTNACSRPQPRCPRTEGEDYTKCLSICWQPGHAEAVAISKGLLAVSAPLGGTLYIEGHDRICGPCGTLAANAGVAGLVFGAPPEVIDANS